MFCQIRANLFWQHPTSTVSTFQDVTNSVPSHPGISFGGLFYPDLDPAILELRYTAAVSPPQSHVRFDQSRINLRSLSPEVVRGTAPEVVRGTTSFEAFARKVTFSFIFV